WNLISGLTGYVSFGHVAFFGAGAYAGALLVASAGWPWPLAALAGGAAAVLLAVVIGYPCLRLKGPYFAIAMLGLNEVLRALGAFLLSAAGPGVAGALMARDQGYIEPISVFPLAITVTMIVMALFGGKGTVFGPVIGAVVLFVAQEIVWARYPYVHPLLFGAI